MSSDAADVITSDVFSQGKFRRFLRISGLRAVGRGERGVGHCGRLVPDIMGRLNCCPALM